MTTPRPEQSTPQTARTRFFLIFTLLGLGIIAGGGAYYRHYEQRYRDEVVRQLSVLGTMKAEELKNWREGQIAIGKTFHNNAAFSALVRHHFDNPGDADTKRRLQNWLDCCQSANQYLNLFLMDTGGVVRLSSNPALPEDVPDLIHYAASLQADAPITFLDFHRDRSEGSVHLALLVPLIDEPDGTRPLGVLALLIDPNTYLFPFLEKWPLPSHSGRTQLVRRDGDEVVYLNTSKAQTNAPLTLRAPLTRTEIPAVKAVLGQVGIVSGKDFHGTPVIADLRSIPDSPWFLVSRMNADEIYESLKKVAWIIGLLVGLLIVGAGGSLSAIWQQLLKSHYRDLLTAERDRESAKREALKTLEQETHNLHAVMTASPIALLVMSEGCQIVYANPAAERIFGQKLGELDHKTCGELLSCTHRRQCPQGCGYSADCAACLVSTAIRDTFSTGLPVIAKEARVIRETNSGMNDFWVRFGTEPVTFNGLKHVVLALDDITARKKTEVEVVGLLQQSERNRLASLSILEDHKRAEDERNKLQARLVQSQRLEAIGTLAGGVAHEINNPIMGITGYTQLILDEAAPDSPISSYAREITKESARVAAIVKNLLSFARQDTQPSRPANVHDIIADTLLLIKTVIRHDEIDLQVDVPANLPALSCRSEQLRQVIMNLLTNARDALNGAYPQRDPRKIIQITARTFDENNRPWIRITVADHGPGIPPEIRDRLFDPFFTTKPSGQGTGLGLSISHGIVREHGGRLWVESETGQGARFHMDLPVSETTPPAKG